MLVRNTQLLLLCCLLISFSAVSQDTDSLPRTRRFICANVFPEFTYRTQQPNSTTRALSDALDSTERARISTGLSLSFGYRLTSKVRIQAGLQFSDQGEQTKQLNTTESIRYKNHFYLLGLRCTADYGISNKNLRYFGSLSLIPSYLIGSKTQLQTENSDQVSVYAINKGYTPFTIAADISMGIQWQIVPATQLMIAPFYRKSLTSVTTSSLKKFFYSYGLNIGFVHFM